MPNQNGTFLGIRVPELPWLKTEDEIFEECPVCEGEAEGCNWCDESGLVEHDCAGA